MPLHALEHVPEFRFGDGFRIILDFELVGQFARPRDLVLLAFVFGESYGERFDGRVLFGKACGHVARIDARGEKRPYFDVGDVVVAYRIVHRRVNGLDRVLAAAGFVEVVAGYPVALVFDRSIGAHGQAVGGREFEDALEKGFGESRELEAQVLLERFFVEFALVGRVFEDALDFGGKDELRAAGAVRNGVVERFDAEEVACAEEFLLLGIPDCECEHAAYFFE